MSDIESNINWDDVLKKEARGLDDEDLGEVHEVGSDFIVTQKGTINKHKYYLPKNLAVKFDGHKLWFKITKDEVDKYKHINENNIADDTIATSTTDYGGSSINWDDVLKKEARGADDDDFGEVHEVGSEFIVTQKGTINKHKYYLPKNLAVKFDGHKLWFKITKDEVDKYKHINENNIADDTIATDTPYSTNNNLGDNNVIADTTNYGGSSINWDDVLKKEARGADDDDFGEVHEVGSEFIVTQKGTVNKHKYYLPKNLAVKFDGHKLWFKITKDEVDKYKKD